jgi:hypothetical protein
MKNKILDVLSAIFAFRTIPTTVFLVLIYATIFSAVLLTDELPNPPASVLSDLDDAYANLHTVKPPAPSSHVCVSQLTIPCADSR